MRRIGYSLLLALGLITLQASISNARFPKTVGQRMYESSMERK